MAFDAAALDVAAIGQGITLLSGDCRTVLPTLATNSVQCVVTSPPYYGLRDYGVAGQIGLEATPDEFIAQMVAVFREVNRVLRDDGTCWINLGDSYNANQGSGFDTNQNGGRRKALAASPKTGSGGLAPKQLLMMPARVALALQADGWWLRSAIVWAKPNPMPESVTDRPVSSYEMVYLLTKRSRYYYDADAIAEPSIYPDDNRKARQRSEDYQERAVDGRIATINPLNAKTYPTRSCRNVWTIATSPFSAAHFATFPPDLAERCIKAGSKLGDTILDPFAGAGTALLVADRLQRNAIGIELNTAYTTMAMDRVRADAPLFSSWPPAEDPADQRLAADAMQRDLFESAA